uniref:(northern house mosquito) hypothetical protein n=1 Tax=Culex pipiens TaxID=7175 RepID=A0A8D8HZL9_CULPI
MFLRAPPLQRLAKKMAISLHKQHNQKHRQPAEQRRNVPQMEPALLIREPLLLAGGKRRRRIDARNAAVQVDHKVREPGHSEPQQGSEHHLRGVPQLVHQAASGHRRPQRLELFVAGGQRHSGTFRDQLAPLAQCGQGLFVRFI